MSKIADALSEKPLTFTGIMDATKIKQSTLHDRLSEMVNHHLVKVVQKDVFGSKVDVYELPYPREDFMFQVFMKLKIPYHFVKRTRVKIRSVGRSENEKKCAIDYLLELTKNIMKFEAFNIKTERGRQNIIKLFSQPELKDLCRNVWEDKEIDVDLIVSYIEDIRKEEKKEKSPI